MVDGFDLYHLKLYHRGRNPRERMLKVKTKDFNRYFENTLNRESVLITNKDNKTKAIEMVFQDHSQSNNKQLSDDKYIIARNEDPVHVGDYIKWRDDYWMVFTKEFKTIPSHQQALVKNANQVIKWIRNGEVINDGEGYHAYVQSQTLYTMGVSETTYIDVVDGKMMMYMQHNKDTADLRQDERVVIGSKVFKIKFMDYVSRQGLVSFLMDEDRIHEDYDNLELGVADYYRFFNKDEDYTDTVEENSEPIIDSPVLEIAGNKYPKIGSINSYEANFDVLEWVVEDSGQEGSYYLQHKDNQQITIKIKDDYRFIGTSMSIIAKDVNGEYTTIPIMISKKF